MNKMSYIQEVVLCTQTFRVNIFKNIIRKKINNLEVLVSFIIVLYSYWRWIFSDEWRLISRFSICLVFWKNNYSLLFTGIKTNFFFIQSDLPKFFPWSLQIIMSYSLGTLPLDSPSLVKTGEWISVSIQILSKTTYVNRTKDHGRCELDMIL